MDPGVQHRLTGWSIDFLIIFTMMAIQMVIVQEYIVPIIFISLARGIATTMVVFYIGRRTWSYSLERTVGVYGITTRIVYTGLLLLRIADPEFNTPVALVPGMQALFAAPFVFRLHASDARYFLVELECRNAGFDLCRRHGLVACITKAL